MTSQEVFNQWLTQKLESFDIDDEVLGSYISSIITSDESDSEKKDSLKDILAGVTHDVDIDSLCDEIMDKWSECHKSTCDVKKEG
ncbi:Coiled-coil domain-containing protein 43, partial [Stegodyphus mimosarum]